MTVVYLDCVFLLNSVVDYLLFLCAAGEYHVFGNNRGKYEKCKTGSLG